MNFLTPDLTPINLGQKGKRAVAFETASVQNGTGKPD